MFSPMYVYIHTKWFYIYSHICDDVVVGLGIVHGVQTKLWIVVCFLFIFLPYVFRSWIWIFYMLRLKCLEKGMSMDMYFWLIRWLGDIFYLHFLFSFIFSTFFLKIRNDKKRGKILIIKKRTQKGWRICVLTEFVY